MPLEKINLEQLISPEASAISTPQINVANTNNTTLMTKAIPFLIIVILGVGSGFVAFNFIRPNFSGTVSSENAQSSTTVTGLKVGETIGIEQTEFEADEVMGILEAGGFEGEGSHHLARPGGVDQTAYLTSSVVDLDQFVGHKITVWGQTFAAQKAGWLMDVVRVRLEELNPQAP